MTDKSSLSALLTPEHITLNLRAASKAAVLTDLARLAAALCDAPEHAITAALVARESLGSTGVGAGIALPHARLPGLAGPIVMVARLARPVGFDAIDGQPVDLVFLLLTREGADGNHLALLAAASRRLRDRTVADAIRAARTPDEVIAHLTGP